MAKKNLEDMVSAECIKEIKDKIRNFVGKKAMLRIYPAVKKIIEEGDGEIRESILHDWLDVDSVRICTECGEIMQEGWYLDLGRYACSDECCCKIMGVSKEEFDRYSIFLPEIEEHLKDEGEGRKPEELTKGEIKEIIDEIMDNLDAYYYTEWS